MQSPTPPLPAPPQNRSLPPLLKFLAVALFTLTVIAYFAPRFMTHVLHAGAPYDQPSIPGEKHLDLAVFGPQFTHFGSPAFWSIPGAYPMTYPAPAGLVFALLFQFPHTVRLYLLLCQAGLLCGAFLLARAFTRRGIAPLQAYAFAAVFAVTSWPFFFLYNRANLEGVLVVITAAGLYAVLRDRCWTGALLLGLAGAMKLFPFIFLALLLSKKRYKEFFAGLLAGAVIMLVSLALLGPTIEAAQAHISAGLLYFRSTFAATILKPWITYDHSLFGYLKLLIAHFYFQLARTPTLSTFNSFLSHALTVYLAFAALAGTLLYFLRIRKLPLLNQLLAVSVCSVFLPPVSFDYTLLHLFLPFTFLCLYLLEQAPRAAPTPGLTPAILTFLLIWPAARFPASYQLYAGQVRAFGLAALLLIVLIYPFAPHAKQPQAME